MIYDELKVKKYKGNKYFDYYDKEYKKYYPDLGIPFSDEKALDCARLINERLMFGKKQFKSVIDIGCGPGVFLNYFKSFTQIDKAVGTDISMFVLKEAQKQNPNLDFYRADSESLPFKAGSFELATIIDVIEHVEHPEVMIKEVGRVAKYVLLKVPMEDNLFMWLQSKLIRVDWKKIKGHINFYNFKSLNKFMEEQGFELIGWDIPNQRFIKMDSLSMSVFNILQVISNLFPKRLRTKIMTTEFIGLYRRK
jgi:SAM-dependent methyltransferase